MTWDGAIRKWLLPQFEQIVFVLKDVLLLILAVLALEFTRRHERARIPAAARSILILYGVLVISEIVNPNAPNALVSIWGIKSHLLPAAMILVLPAAFRSNEDLQSWMARWFGPLAIPVCILAFIQLSVGPNHPLNQVVRGGMESIAYFGSEGLVRVSGSFSYVSGLAGFVLTMFLLGTGLLLAGRRAKTLLIGLAALAAALPATGSRSVIVGAVAGLAGMLLCSVYARLMSPISAIRIAGAAIVLGAASVILQGNTWTALSERAERAGDNPSGRLIESFAGGLEKLDDTPTFGFGAGTTNFGSVALVPGVSPFSWLPPGLEFESESGRVMLELGLFGWILSLLLRLTLFAWAIRLLGRRRLPSTRSAAVLALGPLAIGLWSGTGVFAVPFVATGYWFAVAALGLAERDELRARQLAKANDWADPLHSQPMLA